MITLWYGDNSYDLAQALGDWMAEHPDVIRIDGELVDRSSWQQHLMGVSLFSPRREAVIRNASKNRDLWQELAVLPDDDLLDMLLVESKPDKRTATFKQLQKSGNTREFTSRTPLQLIAWLQQQAAAHNQVLSPAVARRLIERVGDDQWRLSSELSKILLMSPAEITRELVDIYTEASLETTTFELLDALFAGESSKVERLTTQLERTEDPYRFIGLVVSQVFAIALIAHATSLSDSLAKQAGIHPFVLKRLSPLARSLGTAGVEKLVAIVAQLDRQLKTTGQNPWLLIRAAFARVLLLV
jgi:DNA polymerase III delta subunit